MVITINTDMITDTSWANLYIEFIHYQTEINMLCGFVCKHISIDIIGYLFI